MVKHPRRPVIEEEEEEEAIEIEETGEESLEKAVKAVNQVKEEVIEEEIIDRELQNQGTTMMMMTLFLLARIIREAEVIEEEAEEVTEEVKEAAEEVVDIEEKEDLVEEEVRNQVLKMAILKVPRNLLNKTKLLNESRSKSFSCFKLMQ